MKPLVSTVLLTALAVLCGGGVRALLEWRRGGYAGIEEATPVRVLAESPAKPPAVSPAVTVEKPPVPEAWFPAFQDVDLRRVTPEKLSRWLRAARENPGRFAAALRRQLHRMPPRAAREALWALAKADPAAAVEAAALVRGEASRKIAGEGVLGAMHNATPEELTRAARRLGLETLSKEFTDAVTRRARTDPAWARAVLEDPEQRDRLISGQAGALAAGLWESNPGAAWRLTLENPSTTFCQDPLCGVIIAAARRDPSAALKLLQDPALAPARVARGLSALAQVVGPALPPEELTALTKQAEELNPHAAGPFAAKEARRAAGELLLAHDPVQALAWAEKLPPDYARDDLKARAMLAANGHDFPAVLNALENSGEQLNQPLGAAAGLWAKTDPRAATDYVARFPESEAANVLAQYLDSVHRAAGPEALRAWRKRLPENLTRSLAPLRAPAGN